MDTWEGKSYEPLSLHKYAYCNFMSLNAVDPSGNNLYVNLAAQAVIRTGVNAINAVRAYSSVTGAQVLAFHLEAAFLQAMFYAEVALGVLALSAATLSFLDEASTRLLNNLDEIPDDPFERGRAIENKMGANLNGNVEAIDDFRDGTGTSIKSHARNTPKELMSSIRRDLRALDDLENRDITGTSTDGRRIRIPAGSIQNKVLAVAVPQNQASWARSPQFRIFLESVQRSSKTIIRIIPVRGWIKR